MPKRLVVSAVNLVEGGTLTVLRDCLAAAVETLPPEWEIIAVVHDRKLFSAERVRFIDFPDVKRSWLRRLYHEFFQLGKLSRELKPDVWFSLHDMSPRVQAPRQVVYCHNPSPFYRPRLREALWEPKFFLFTLFYRYLYRINIHANTLVVVQQDWIRREFQRMYGVDHVAVAHPVINESPRQNTRALSERPDVFFYPSLPRVFKNFEVLCEAAQILYRRLGDVFEVRLTLSGNESRYAAYLHRRYSTSPVIRFIGLQNKEQMIQQYQEASTVVFPSRLETWGLPISEAKHWGKTLLVADLPYAHETVGDYGKVIFFDSLDPNQLADFMEAQLENELQVGVHTQSDIAQPFAANWDELIRLVIGEPVSPVAERP
ncbi:MAG: glycosyltransferase [Porticoccaceae bacterium]|nr:glycosyltransferase [Porticoccaceae bacterium]